MSERFSQTVREQIFTRAGGLCEWCGKQLPTEAHHRKYRSRGGSHGPENAAALCGRGNHSGCHGKAHRGGNALGFSVPSGHDPERFWVLSARWGWCRFLRDGGVAVPAHVAPCVVHEEVTDRVAAAIVCEECVLVEMAITGEEVRRSWT